MSHIVGSEKASDAQQVEATYLAEFPTMTPMTGIHVLKPFGLQQRQSLLLLHSLRIT